MDEKKREINHICSLIESMAEKYHTHPDPIARLYGALHEVSGEIIRRMNAIREDGK